MTRYAAGVEYVGTGFSGWQALPGLNTVQQTLEDALSSIADHPLSVVGSGRTDAGVHALQQVIHFDSGADRSVYAWQMGANSRLPPQIKLRWLQPVADHFHARYAALRRHYRYLIYNSRARSALLAQRCCWFFHPLDALAMHQAAQALIGEHDFSAFRDSQCQSRTPMRNIEAISVQRHGDWLAVDVIGNAFLHHMVRNIVGTLLLVGQGKQPQAWVAEVLAGRDRTRAGMTAPADGLYLLGAQYALEFGLPPVPSLIFPPI